MTPQTKRMFINAQGNEVRIAITIKNKLVDLDTEGLGSFQQRKSNIYKGRISSIEPSLAAVFVDYGSERHGFLPFKEISPEYYLTSDADVIRAKDMKKLLRLGQEVVVQIEKEERGSKGAALTTFISLAGSYLVLMPNNPRAGGISRRVEAAEREHLQALLKELSVPESMGLIVRTAGVGRSKEELAWDLTILMSYWEAIKKAAIQKPAPYLIHQESDVITREIRDYLREDVAEVIIDDVATFERAREYVNLIKPDFLPRLKLYQEALPLFHHYQIEKQIESAYLHEIRLQSGGSIVIDHTEALVAIDINSARATKGADIEETALHTNLEAAEEIARQLRLRDLGGLIVIDFIDMSPAKNQREVENLLRDSLKSDRARIQVGKISRFGLLEMSRQRLASALSRSNMTTCKNCQGQGMVRSIESLSISIIHRIQEQVGKASGLYFELQLPPAISAYLMNEKRETIQKIEQSSSSQITIIPNHHLSVPNYLFKYSKYERKGAQNQLSHDLVKEPKSGASTDYKRTPEAPAAEKPMVDRLSTEKLMPAPRTKSAIAKIWKNIVSSLSQPETEVKKETTDNRRSSSSSRNYNRRKSHSSKRQGQSSRRGGQGSYRGSQGSDRKGSDHNRQQTVSKSGQSSEERGAKSSSDNSQNRNTSSSRRNSQNRNIPSSSGNSQNQNTPSSSGNSQNQNTPSSSGNSQNRNTTSSSDNSQNRNTTSSSGASSSYSASPGNKKVYSSSPRNKDGNKRDERR